MGIRHMEEITEFKKQIALIEKYIDEDSFPFSALEIHKFKSSMLKYKLDNPDDPKIDTLIQIMESLDNVHEKKQNEKINHRLNLLTIWSTIFLPLSFFTGMWGMNFDDVPLISDDKGFWVFSFLCVTTILGMWLYFKKNKWF
jgi:hypothetical protein